MKKFLSIIFLSVGITAFSQQVENIEVVLNDKISIRALELYDNKVWYSGSESKFGFVDLKDTKIKSKLSFLMKSLNSEPLHRIRTRFMQSIL